ncbi:tetratricopeptide repeat protein [Sphingorhabdus arenilitoris]|uniref:Tetratricopeptide repeat protein n=1 Tax=Sphingorhabdus arenilitoris TaxID=1490041 RepID=A0ABV8REF8_9SPHN
MSDSENQLLCPDEELSSILEVAGRDDEAGLDRLDNSLTSYPLDPRLHFLRGSVLAGLQRYEDGRHAMARAIEIHPDYALARFQLGFLDFTSGNVVEAIGVWKMLFDLADDEPLKLFAQGLINLSQDQFSECRRCLEKGISLNNANPAMNNDMMLILDEIAGLTETDVQSPTQSSKAAEEHESAEETVSATSMLLKQFAVKRGDGETRH